MEASVTLVARGPSFLLTGLIWLLGHTAGALKLQFGRTSGSAVKDRFILKPCVILYARNLHRAISPRAKML